MAIRQLVVSDISGTEVSDDSHARIVVEHPDFPMPLEIDASTEEGEKFQNTALRLVTVTVYAPNVPPRKAVVETKTLDKLFGTGVDFNKVLEGARKAEAAAPRAARGRPAGRVSAPRAASGEKVNYTDPDRYGQLHRGRLTDEEISLVQNNREQASKNREAQTGKPIDWADPAEVKRYRL